MNRINLNLAVHLALQILAQSAVVALVPPGGEKWVAAAIAVLGVFAAFLDQSLSKE